MSKHTTHNYLKTHWGHDYTFSPRNGGYEASMSGWGTGIKKGDFLLIGQLSSLAFYRVTKIRYCDDPRDMWFAEVEFAERSEKDNMDDLKRFGLLSAPESEAHDAE